MNKKKLKKILQATQEGTLQVNEALAQLSHFDAETLSEACIDHHRDLRTGIPEVIYGASKTAKQIISIAKNMQKRSQRVIATRVSAKKADKVCSALDWLTYHETARILSGNLPDVEGPQGRGIITIVSAGTSDLPVAEEAAVTARCLGHRVEKLHDVGVAGLHRLLGHTELLYKSTVIIVVAGMEGALPSVVGGLVACPVVAVPTSVGYGANLGGVTPLLAMLNSCAPGVAVVNIDNGFGAACMAVSINQ